MRNAVSMLVYNQVPEQLRLTKEAITSVLEQDIPVDLFVVDNGSTDDGKTWAWLQSIACESICLTRYMQNRSPVKVANDLMSSLFNDLKYPHILGVPNDCRLPSNCYSQLLRWPRGFVSASDIGQTEPTVYEAVAVNECTPMAVMVTRRWAYDAIVEKYGHFFDDGFFHYASDCCLALRMAACGIRGVQTNVPFWHYGSASWRLAKNGAEMTEQADFDRAYFERKYGFSVSDPRYGQTAGDINFRG